jgi:transcriptional regulator with XRE-family HTH domain
VGAAMARELREIFEHNLRRAATAKGLSLVMIANRAGLTTEQLTAIFAGTFDPDLNVLNAISAAIGVPLSKLFYDPEQDTRLN